ncbi:TPA: Rha family transcriptional regulator [Clostridium perfringens]|uniref:Rha family transcriptional regulator n=1 Tax=Clostridium perfringens TaxID=1502 RepID=UPI0007079816|nr:Rha family transcriptional regulator [Clostridium perfringens]KAB8120856.1 hypothetical protein FVB38_04265 [Clostridium perfringens]KQC91955.1 hypothetical protein AM596_11340 [Clostridium perfringens CP4]
MNNLVLKQEIEEVTLTSLEVAEMLGKRHDLLIREIEGRKDETGVGIIPVLENANLVVSKYFIPSTYKSGTREYKCYEITKMGCHMLGNKLQGEKGILFTAKYVERFNEMEKQLSSGQSTRQISAIDLFEAQVQAFKEVKQQINEVNHKALEAKAKSEKLEERMDNQTLSTAQTKKLKKLANSLAVPLVGGKGSKAYDFMIRKVYKDIYRQLFRELGVNASDEIKVKDFNFALDVMNNYKIATALKNEIDMLNNQSQLNI